MSEAASCMPDPELRARLRAARVAIIGCGGLGSNVAAMLLRSGVRTLTLIDFDTVAEDNLNRQMFFRDQIGRLKTEALAETLLRIDPGADLRLVTNRISSADLIDTVRDADVIAEAVDTAQTKAMIIDLCTRDLPEIPLVTVSGLAGYASANRIATERLADNLYVVGDLESDIRDGLSLLASRVMVASAHQAHAIIRILLECEDDEDE
ncbi:MAG: sulfur carrier protein ThiS adenylyltransferase ThiF [Actinomycetota bacterium]|nr:sulfur carrier protein ThiS adenylyltransferase ThiF [Actinomycetota bacterium]